jgi:exopolysaccharide biosynthesis polyprenyl glycosylphosphotransferase
MRLTEDVHEDADPISRSVTQPPGFRGPPRRDWRPLAIRTRRTETDALAEVRLRERRYRRALAFSDMLAALTAVVVALGLFGGDDLRPAFVVAILFVVSAAKVQGLYDRDELVINKSTLDELPRLFNLATLFALLVWLSRHFIIFGAPTTTDLLTLWALLLVSLTGGRMIARRVAAHASPTERCMLLGEITIYHRLSARLAGDPHLELVGWAPLEDVAMGRSSLTALVERSRIQRIVIAPGETLTGDEVIDVVRAAKATGLRVSLLPGILGTVGSSVVFDDLGGIVLLGVPRFGLSHSSALVKRAFDLVGAGILLVATSPVMLVAMLVIKRDSPGGVFFRQTRVGRNGEPFLMIKLRTMIDGADAMKLELAPLNEADGLFKIANDPRITRPGRWLRRTHLDELPQLLNVMRGEMSLVGPRPLVLDDDERVLGTDRRRLHLTPGMTGHWQILGAARVPLAEMVKLDYLYIANWSLWGDVKIIVRTIPVMVGRRGQ